MNYVDKQFIVDAVSAHSDMVMRIAYQYVRNRSGAEYITQNVFASLLKQSTFSSQEHLKAWLMKVAINKSRDSLKKVIVKRKISSEEMHQFDFSKKEVSMHNELARLTHDEREIIFLHFYEGYQAREISILLEVKETIVYKKLELMRKRYKDFFADSMYKDSISKIKTSYVFRSETVEKIFAVKDARDRELARGEKSEIKQFAQSEVEVKKGGFKFAFILSLLVNLALGGFIVYWFILKDLM